MDGIGRRQWRHPRECQVGRCNRDAVLSVNVRLHLVELKAAGGACREHAAELADILAGELASVVDSVHVDLLAGR
jgi:hypothetical protein